jgi:hypothetical protein
MTEYIKHEDTDFGALFLIDKQRLVLRVANIDESLKFHYDVNSGHLYTYGPERHEKVRVKYCD